MNYKLYLVSAMLLLSGCDLIDYHPYDVKIEGETDCNKKNIDRIEKSCKDKKSIRFAFMGDSQRWYDETKQFVTSINRRDDIDFVIHGGDMSDFGVTKEFMWQRDIMLKLKVPFVALLGNHDCLGTGKETFNALFGNENFAFIAGGVKFVCLNTNALEFDYSKPVPDFNYMVGQLTERSDEFDKTVITMHAAPFSDVFNNNVAQVFEYYVREFPNVQFCAVAHDHNVTAKDIYDDGIIYYGSTCMKDRCYLVFTITEEAYTYEVVYY